MILKQMEKRAILKKTKSKEKFIEIRNFSIISALKSSIKFMLRFKRTFAVWIICNFAFLHLFSYIPNGWTNSLSIVWLVAYYVFWCIFIRYIQQHPPYFSIIRIFNGLIPASKIMFINISIYMFIAIVPFIPLFMGFRDKYLEFFEGYMELIGDNDSLFGTSLFYIFMLLISPFTITRPYLAWIASLIGKSRSIMEAYKRSRGNYWKFILCGIIMSLPFIVLYDIKKIYGISITIYIGAILPIYFNIVFLNIYKAFYKRKPKIKQSAG